MQSIKIQLGEILDKKMDRRDFLKHIAIGLVALTGANTALRLLSPQQRNIGGGYGSSAYGGHEDSGSHR